MSDPQTHVAFQAPEIAQLAPLFPGYEIECLIATGGMGAVYRAIQKSLDRTVAIKILPHEFSKDAAFCAGFEAEAKAMARLNHPNLIGVYDFGDVNGMLYIIMEYVPGKSLFHSSHGIAIDPAEVIRLVTGICDGLSHAHEHGILHRDIKPSNILLDLNAQPKIGDFGLARPIENKIQEGEEIFGTPHYTAPEVVNSPHSVDYRADIFSVGVMLHELLTGMLPADDRRSASAIIHCDPRFDAIIRRATHPMPEARYHNAAEISKDLHAIAASAGPRVLQTAAPKASIHPKTPSRRRPIPTANPSSGIPGVFIFLIIAALVIVAFTVISNRNTDHEIATPEPPRVPANTAKTPATPPVATTPHQPNSRPWVEPDPEITPTPETETDSDSEDETDSQASHPTPEPDPDTESPPVTKPKFDVPGFLERARKIMQDRAAPIIAKANTTLDENLSDYERAAKRLIRKLDWGDRRDYAETALDELIAECKENGNRIPPQQPRGLGGIFGIKDLLDEHLEKQQTIEKSLFKELSILSGIYIAGLQKQIERLKADNDPPAITLIDEEIEKTRTLENYFPNLMLGIKSDAKDGKKDEDDDEEKAPLKFGN